MRSRAPETKAFLSQSARYAGASGIGERRFVVELLKRSHYDDG